MKAAVINQFGDADQFQIIQHLDEPKIADDEVLLKVHCASINPIDWKTRKGLGWAAQSIKDKLPWILGFDVSGEVSAIGNAVSSFGVGSRVCTTTDMLMHGGSYAEQIAISASRLVSIPDNIDFKTAAALPLAGMTAWQALDFSGVKANDKVLVLGGAGGVGHLCCQLANIRGAAVSATASIRNKSFLQKLGTTPIDYNERSLKENFYDCIIDLVGGDTGIEALKALKNDGKMITLPSITAKEIIEVAETHGKNAETMLYQLNTEELGEMLALLSAGKMKIEIEEVYSLSDIALAHQVSEKGHARGKIIIDVINE